MAPGSHWVTPLPPSPSPTSHPSSERVLTFQGSGPLRRGRDSRTKEPRYRDNLTSCSLHKTCSAVNIYDNNALKKTAFAERHVSRTHQYPAAAALSVIDPAGRAVYLTATTRFRRSRPGGQRGSTPPPDQINQQNCTNAIISYESLLTGAGENITC